MNLGISSMMTLELPGSSPGGGEDPREHPRGWTQMPCGWVWGLGAACAWPVRQLLHGWHEGFPRVCSSVAVDNAAGMVRGVGHGV